MPPDMTAQPASSAFVPLSLMKVFDSHAEASATFEGVVLFVDMSGYTMLAEDLCSRSPDGHEELSRLLNDAFTLLIDCIHHAGGEIASFAGDALLAFWPADGQPLEQVALNAEACALALHDAKTPPAPGRRDLPALHVGIARGELWAAQLGGVDRAWHQILAGPAARAAFDACHQAGPGDTISIATPKRSQVEGARYRGLADSPSLFVAASDMAMSRADKIDQQSPVPRMVREWWPGETRRWLPQVRVINAMFVKIGGLPAERDGHLDIYQQAITLLQRAIRPFSASSGTLVADDKGLVFKLYYGMPYNNHGNDAARALETALRIRDDLQAIGLRPCIGIASGQGICMPLGHSQRLEYTTIGRFSHIAARLMDQARSSVLCTRDVAELAGREITFAEQPPLELKGVGKTLEIFQAEGKAPVRQNLAKLVGRAAEQQRIDAGLKALHSGEGGLIHIVGDAGLGKSALINYLVDRAEASNLTVLVGHSTMSEFAVPFDAWRPVFATLLELGEEALSARADPRESTERLRDLPERFQKQLPLLNSVLPGLIDAPAPIDSLSGEARADAILALLSNLFRFLVPPGFVLVLEDCHWMDSASWRLLQRLISIADDILIVLTSRPHFDDRQLSALHSEKHFEQLRLAPLDAEHIRDVLLTSMAHGGIKENGADWLDRAVNFAAGNPLFAKEYAHLISMQRHGVTNGRMPKGGPNQRAASSRTGDAVNPRSLSMTLQGLITSRLDSLSPPDLLTLKAASVIGGAFDLTLLQQVTPVEADRIRLSARLDDLARHHIILASDQTKRNFRFQHDLIREVVYGQMTRQQRQELHRRAAEAIERVQGQNLTSQFAILADHWSKADQGPFTLHYAELAAEQAIRSGGYVEARRFLKLCFDKAGESADLQPSTPRRLRWHRLSADVHLGLGNLVEREREANAALKIFGVPRTTGKPKPRLIAHIVTRTVFWAGGHIAKKFGLRHRYGHSDVSLELARLHRHNAAVAWFSNDPLAMTAHSIDALGHAEHTYPSDVLAGASVEFGGILGLIGLRPLGRAMMQRALVIAEQIDDPAMVAYVHLLICLYEVGVSHWQRADRHALACEALCEQSGDHVDWRNVQAVRFWSPYYQNRLDDAASVARRFQSRIEVDGNDQHRAWAHRFTALCHLRNRQPALACHHLEQALTLLEATSASNETFPAWSLLALARFRTGDRGGAYQAALDGYGLMETILRPTGHAMLEGYASLAEITFLAMIDDRGSPTWERAFTQCLQGLKRYQAVFPIGRPRYRLWRALQCSLHGHHASSERQFRRAHQAANRLGMAWEQEMAAKAMARSSEKVMASLFRRSSDPRSLADLI